MAHVIVESLAQTLRNFWYMVMRFVPNLLVMLIIFLLGWFVAAIAKLVMRRLLRLVRFNELCEKVGASQVLKRAALPPPTELLSRLIFWVLWVGFLLVGITALGIAGVQEQVSRILFLLPQIFVALLVLFVGLLAANFFARATLLAAVNANLPSARLLASFVRFIIVLLAITMALEQVAVSQRALLVAFSIAFGAVMLSLAIAFGVGGHHVARRILEKRFLEDEKEHEEISPL